MAPTEKQGFASKTSRSGKGLFTSTSDRFFSLSNGEISYYSTATKEVKKGSMFLHGASASKKSSTEIYINVKDGNEYGLNMIFKTESECSAWLKAVNEHIEYFSDNKSNESIKKSHLATSTVSADDISDEILEASIDRFVNLDERSIQRIVDMIRRRNVPLDNFGKFVSMLGFKLQDEQYTDASLPPGLKEFQVLAKNDEVYACITEQEFTFTQEDIQKNPNSSSVISMLRIKLISIIDAYKEAIMKRMLHSETKQECRLAVDAGNMTFMSVYRSIWLMILKSQQDFIIMYNKVVNQVEQTITCNGGNRNGKQMVSDPVVIYQHAALIKPVYDKWVAKLCDAVKDVRSDIPPKLKKMARIVEKYYL